MQHRRILDHFDVKDELIEDWRLYIGPKSDYYIKEWLKVRTGHIFSFNVSAFFFGIFWLLYRKMYQPAVLYLSIFFAEGFIETVFFNYQRIYIHPLYWNIGRLLVFSMLLGLLGNWIFYNYSQVQITMIKERFPKNYQPKLSSKGGTSFMPILGLISFVFLSYLLQLYLLHFQMR